MSAPFYPAFTAPAVSLFQSLREDAVQWLDWAIESRCLLCEDARETRGGLCTKCQSALPLNHQHCDYCAAPLFTDSICGRCQKSMPQFDQVVAPVLYEEPIDKMICDLKYREKLTLARVASELIADSVLKSGQKKPDLICSVPMTSRALRKRGFNQAALIAKLVGKRLGIKVAYGLLRKTRDTAHQSELDAKNRSKNLKKVFQCDRMIMGLHLALIDDVLTTGATASEVSAALKTAGAARVDLCVCARAADTLL